MIHLIVAIDRLDEAVIPLSICDSTELNQAIEEAKERMTQNNISYTALTNFILPEEGGNLDEQIQTWLSTNKVPYNEIRPMTIRLLEFCQKVLQQELGGEIV